MKSWRVLAVAALALSLPISSLANKTETVGQVTATVNLTDDVDYIITDSTPFAENGVVNIVNTDHAVLILQSVKPSAAARLLADHVTINGQPASRSTNCQVKIYNRGCIILPYGVSTKPLTVYSQPDFSGESCNDFSTGSTGGYMNTLTDAQLNNRIQSFKLKRGYMVTFSTRARGRGYSRCFIAADQDLEVPLLPGVLNNTISSYRIFRWNDTSKAGLANDTRSDPNAQLNTTSCYSFGLGEDRGPDQECVPHHIYEDWPSAAACGGVGYSPHLKTNNEPRNSADDHPQDLETILNNWENLMATGMRLCTPSSWDGSDYWNATGFLAAFLDSIDARGWRCDIIDLHCYWAEGSFANIKNWVNAYHRPVWISEWVWGASWNNNGIFGIATGTRRDNPTESDLQQNRTVLSRILNNLNSWDYVERYFYWNSEANCSKIYRDGQLTPAGEFYSQMNTGLGYNGRYDFVPRTPRQYDPANFKVTTDGTTATISWRDLNGEYNRLMEVQRKQKGGQWETLFVAEQKETAANYTYTDTETTADSRYRIHLRDVDGHDRYTDDALEAGDAIDTADGRRLYAGGNLLANGSFDLGMQGWVSGTGQPIGQPYFQVVEKGGIDGGRYLQAYQAGDIGTAASLKTPVAIVPGADYLFRLSARGGNDGQRLSLSADGATESQTVATVSAATDWQRQQTVFNSGDCGHALIAFRQMGTAQIGQVELRRLFPTREEAIDDAFTQIQQRARAVMDFNSEPALEALNRELETALTPQSATPSDREGDLLRAEAAIDALLQSLKDREALDSLTQVELALFRTHAAMPEELEKAYAISPEYYYANYFTQHRQFEQQTLDRYLTYTPATVQPRSADFASASGWQTKAGTYKGGDQRTNTVLGQTCWNAWWSGLNADTGTSNTLEIRQDVASLPEGLYALAVDATTEHYCLSDQHGYLVLDGDTAFTPPLRADYFDLPVGNIWQTLTTTPVYVPEGSTVTVGFASSKQGATDNAWHRYGKFSDSDKREGWWCATRFQLLYHPMHRFTVTPGSYRTICLPYTFVMPDDMKLYRIAGLLADLEHVCLEEVTQPEAGTPYIYTTGQPTLTLLEYGTEAKSAVTTDQKLRGFFVTSARAPIGYYVLEDNRWQRVTGERPRIGSYSALIRQVDGMTVLPTWDGPVLPIVGAKDELDALAVSTPVDNTPKADAKRYTLGGRLTTNPRGVYIDKRGNKTKKQIRTR